MPAKMTFYRSYGKRAIDIAVASILLIVGSPILILALLLLSLANGGKPLFFQRRPGLFGKPFSIVKFKTMNDRTDASGHLLPDAERLTGAGRLVRKTSLDEIPQLVNVLVGDMSLIGPRPLLVEYLPLYDEVQRRRHEVRPGITGRAQVNGRNALSWQEKFALDVWYVDHCSLSLDGRIFLLTLRRVLTGKGISSGTSVTMEKFKGNET